MNDDCHEGATCLQSPAPACELLPDHNDCSSILKYKGLDIAITDSNLTKGQFEDAYLEVWTKNVAPSATWYGWVWIRTLHPSTYWRYDAITLPTNKPYKRVQIPLRELHFKAENDDASPPPTNENLIRETLVEGHIQEFALGGVVEPSTTTIKTDEAYIRR